MAAAILNGNDFELPEKWCINREHFPDICQWFNENHHNSPAWDGDFKKMYNGWYTHYPGLTGGHTMNRIASGYTEITYEQFKEYVYNPQYTLPLEDESPENLDYLIDMFKKLNIE